MRIAFLTREYPPETAWGGIGSFYFSLATALARAGHEVEVFAQALGEERVEREPSGVLVHRVLGRKDGFGPKTGGSTAGSDDLGLFALGLAFAMADAVIDRHLVAPFDLIEGHEHLGVNAILNTSDFIDAVTVTRYHTAYWTLVKRNLVDWPASPLIQALEAASISSAQYRVSTSAVVSDATADDFSAPKADVIIPNFVDAAPYTGKWADKKDQVLFVGRLVLNHKRPDVAVDAFVAFAKDNPTYTMVVAGPDMDHPTHGTVWKYCASRIPKALQNRITYVGVQPQKEIYRLMAESKAMFAPSDFESFGMVAVEAMQHECLPIVSQDTALADLVPEPSMARTRGDAADFAAGLTALLARDDVAALAKRARQYALDTYSEKTVILENIRFFSEKTQRAKPQKPKYLLSPREADKAPLVSIVVPSFNSAAFIDETLASICGQDYANLEVIVADGGSTDGTVEIVKRYPEVILISESDKGQAHAINRGMLRASGEIVAYLNSDDVYRAGAIKTVVDHFKRNPDAQILVGECDYIDEASRTIGHLAPKYSGPAGIVRYWGWEKWHCIPQQAVFWRRNVVEMIGLFDATRHFVMDLDYWIRVAEKYPFLMVPENLAAFRLVAGTKTVSSTDRMYEEEFETFIKYRRLVPAGQRALATFQARRHYSERMLGFAEALYLNEHLRRRALKTTLMALKRFPLRALDIRTWMIAGNLVLTAAGLSRLADRAHNKALRVLWRMRNR
jgi:glycosyltransferase involved in cell wall biosynthesis